MLKQIFYGLFIFLVFSGTVALSANVPDTLNVTAKTSPEGNILAAVSVQNPFSENLASITLKGEYTGSPAHNNTEEIPGTKKYWKATATCNGISFKKNNTLYNNSITYDWQTSSDFVFSAKSNTAAKYTITFSLSFCIRIHKKKSDGTTGEFIRWSPPKTVTTTRDIWIVGIDKIMVKPTNSPDTSYIDSPTEVVALVGTQHTFKVIRTPTDAPDWPSGKPKWTLKTFSEDNQPIVYSGIGDIMNFSADGVTLLDVTLTFECGNKKTVKLINIMPTLESVDFKNGGIQTIADVGLEPEWKKAGTNGQGARNEPFCVIRNKKFDVDFVFSLPEDLTFETTFNAKCSLPNSVTPEITSTHTFTIKEKNKIFSHVIAHWADNMIGKYPCNIKWSIVKHNNNNNNEEENRLLLSNTSHIGYIIWDSYKCHFADFTKKHIDYACSTAQGAITLAGIGDKIGPNATSVNRFINKNTQLTSRLLSHDLSTVWKIIDESKKGDCGTLSTLMKATIQLLGDNSADVMFVYPRHKNWKDLANRSSTASELRKNLIGSDIRGTDLGIMCPVITMKLVVYFKINGGWEA